MFLLQVSMTQFHNLHVNKMSHCFCIIVMSDNREVLEIKILFVEGLGEINFYIVTYSLKNQ